MERPDALRLLELLSRLGGSAITYSRNYNLGAITIGSGRELGRYIAEKLEGSRLRNAFASISQQLCNRKSPESSVFLSVSQKL